MTPEIATNQAETADAALETQGSCVEVTLLWGASVLHVAHLAPPRTFYVGEGGQGGQDGQEASDCFLPPEILGAARAPLVWVDPDGSVSVVLLPGATGTVELPGQAERAVVGAPERGEVFRPYREVPGARMIALPRGSKARIAMGGVVARVGVTFAGKAIAGHFHTSKRALPFHVLSGLVHAGAIAFLATLVPPLTDTVGDGDVTAEQAMLIQHYLASADEREMEEAEAEQVAENTADKKEGGSGTRAKGEEGSTGAMGGHAVVSMNRYGVAGPTDSGDPQVGRQEALRDAAEFGMVGLLNSGAGGDPNAPEAPWGQGGSSSGVGPITQAWGAAGLGLEGIGEGGGGQRGGAGSPGSIGPIGHGAGVGQGAGFGVPQPSADVAPPEPVDAPIDPNGRFATTYRPGGGHLAAFESAVARGIVPVGERELVSDVGARYAPAFDLEPGKALGVRVDRERGALPPSGGMFHVRVAMRGAPALPDARPHLSVHLVLDVSGSMAGEPIAKAREAARALVDRLAPTDDFSLVAFSSDAEVKVPDGLVGPRREAIKAVIDGLREEGGTNIGAGLSLAYTQATRTSIPEDAVRVVLLLSDGQATSGITSRERLSRLALDAFQNGIQTSAFGLGDSYDGPLMSSIATDGAGGYYYLRDGEQIASALSTELDRRLDPVATAVEVRVRLKKGIDLLRVYGSRRLSEGEAARVRTVEVAADRQAEARDHIKRDREDDTAGGMRFFIPAFAQGDSHALLFKLSAPPDAGSRTIGTVELKYKDRLAKKNKVEELPITITYAESDGASAATVDASVARTVQGFAAGEALTEAARRIAEGNREGAVALLAERESILQQAASTLHEPLFLRDASRLARLRAHAGSSAGMGESLVLAMLLETAGRAHLR